MEDTYICVVQNRRTGRKEALHANVAPNYTTSPNFIPLITTTQRLLYTCHNPITNLWTLPPFFLSFFYIYIYCFTRVYVRDTHLIIYSIFLSWFVAQLNNGASFSLLPLLNTTRPPRPTISSLPPLSPCFNHQI